MADDLDRLADVGRARLALDLVHQMTPAVRRWLLDQLVTACALDQEGIEWELGPKRTPASRASLYGLCDHGVPVNHRCYACEPRIGHLDRVDPGG